MKLIWFALLLLSAAWWFLTPIFSPPQWEGFLLLGIGSILFSMCAINRITISLNKKSYFLFIPSFISCFIFSFPYNCGFILLTFALLISLLNKRIFSSIANSIIVLSIVLIAQTLFFPLYYCFAPQNHAMQIFSPFLIWLLKLVGLNSYWQQNSIFIENAAGIINLTTTFEKSGLDFAFLLLFGAVAVILFFKRTHRLKYIGSALFLTLLYGIVRYSISIIIYVYTNQINIFWDRWFVALSFLPLVLLFMKFITLDGLASIPCKIPYSKKYSIISACMLFGTFLFTCGLLFQDPGIKKQGRILVDEKHSNWEWTTQKFDTTWYGEKASYNYYCLYDFISHYYNVQRNFDTLTPGILDKYDILIIKTPTSRFSSNEIEAIVNFVEHGGSLFLIGDHTNVFGTSSCLNPIAQKFGVKYNYDATYDLSSGKLTFYRPTNLLSHPVIQNVDYLLFGTSCSLETGVSSESVITGYGIKSMYLDYSRKNFFPDGADSPTMSCGLFTQMAAVKSGKGRVLFFTDSTIFSNFWMFMSGKPELFLGSLNWLNRQNYLDFLNYLFILFGIGFTALFFILQRKYECNSSLFILLLYGTMGVCVGIVSAYFLNKYCYELPNPHTKYTTVSFDLEHSNIELPDKELTENQYTSYATFYVWTQRINLFPKTDYSLDNAIKNSDVLCVITPDRRFSDTQLQNLYSFVSNGGKLLVMDNSANTESTANAVLQLFSMSYEKQILNQNFSHDTLRNTISSTQQYLMVRGGTYLFGNERGYSVANYVQVGKGKVIAFSDSQLFCDASMGNTNAFPNENQLKIFKFEYDLFDKISNY